jgi:2-oxoglutarate ferredoxin oxidoreductase subunit gamma
MAESISIRFAGKGGQGIIFSGVALARAFSLYEDEGEYNAYQTQSYGPEARGGASKCDVKISKDDNTYPFVEVPDFLIIMSQEAYDRYIGNKGPDTMLFIDGGQVEIDLDVEAYVIRATEKAKEMEATIVANVILLGAFVEITGIITKDSMMRALDDISPNGKEELNRKAFKLGNALGRQAVHSEGRKGD